VVLAAPFGSVALDPGVSLAAVFDGPRLLDPETGEELAILHHDGTWRTPEGVESIGLVLPTQRCSASTTAQARADFMRVADASWQLEAIEIVRRLAGELLDFTTDEVWQRLTHPPREGRQFGPLMRACEREGIIERADEFRPSTRQINHGRPQQVWRSRLLAAPRLFGTDQAA
jgi:hypothetical protein